jgi:hypothetical protein
VTSWATARLSTDSCAPHTAVPAPPFTRAPADDLRRLKMHLRRSTALALGALLLATPALTSCGFNYATDRVNTPAAGVNDHAGQVDVLGAVIVSKQDNSGTFIASLSNNDQENEASFESLAGAEGNTLQAGDFAPIKISQGGLVNLATDGGVPVSGTFKAGEFVPVTLSFGNGEQVVMKVPVVVDDGTYAGLDTSTPSAAPTESPSDSPSETTTDSPSDSPSASPTE